MRQKCVKYFITREATQHEKLRMRYPPRNSSVMLVNIDNLYVFAFGIQIYKIRRSQIERLIVEDREILEFSKNKTK